MAYRRTPRIQARIDAQRTAIVDAAAAVLADAGYGGCTISAVAARAGVAAGTVYNHFSGKVELVAEVFRHLVTREVEVVRAAADSGSATESTVAVLETFARRALKSPRRAYVLLAEPVDPVIDELRLEFRRAFRDVLTSAIRRGVAAGELPPQNAPVVAAALVGALGEALVGPLATGADDADTIPALIEFTLRAIGGRVHADA
ncbi:MAG TPA: TetR/AcrR family transcriptional regulator [Jatrophihabitans sp.]|jgi:AcrR family transcriptional regulator|nr:TetR/AcrR family transcriptional regulator [Jatrophihabitans sp.]